MARLWEQWDPDNPDNNSAAPPNGAPENATNISDLNNILRVTMQSDAQIGQDLTAAVNGLGTMAQQNANAVAITGGTLDAVTITTTAALSAGDITGSAITGTTLTGNGAAVTNVDSTKLQGTTWDEQEPIGTIKLWFGDPALLHPAWALCDGQDGRPKLTGKMPFGVDVNHPLGTEAGQAFDSVNGYDRNTALGGDHNHGGAAGDHILTNAEMPEHTHPAVPATVVSPVSTGEVVTGQPGGAGFSTNNNGTAGGNQPHNHTIAASGDHQHSYNVNTPRLAVYFIIKIANVAA